MEFRADGTYTYTATPLNQPAKTVAGKWKVVHERWQKQTRDGKEMLDLTVELTSNERVPDRIYIATFDQRANKPYADDVLGMGLTIVSFGEDVDPATRQHRPRLPIRSGEYRKNAAK
jgi:hypothetical protein